MKDDEGDVATYPMIKVADCANYPPDIDDDSKWFHQECHDCAMVEGFGNVRGGGELDFTGI